MWFSETAEWREISFQTNIYNILSHSELLLKAYHGLIKQKQLLIAFSYFHLFSSMFMYF